MITDGSVARRIVTKNVDPAPIAGRLPPHDLDAQAMLLAEILLNGTDALDQCVDVLKPTDFYGDGHANIYQAAVGLAQAGVVPDIATVGGWLRDRDMLVRFGGHEYLNSIVNLTAVTKDIRRLAKSIANLKRVRNVISASQLISASGYGDIGEPEQWLADSEAQISTAATLSESDDHRGIAGNDMHGVFVGMLKRLEDASLPGLSTGLHDLDRMLNGLRPGQMMTIGARSHIGKSSLGRQIASFIAGANGQSKRESGALVWSGEQPWRECFECMTLQLAGVSEAKRHTAGRLTANDFGAMSGAGKALACAPMVVNSTPRITPLRLAAEIRLARRTIERDHERRLKKREREGLPKLVNDWSETGPLAVAVVDYVQLMSAQGLVERSANREREISRISELLKEIAMEEQVVMIVMAQLNKEGDTRKDPRPRPGDLRESNKLEQDSDKIVLIYNQSAAERMTADRAGGFTLPESEEVELIVAKARGGGTMGTIKVGFDPTCARFFSLANSATQERYS